MFRRTVQNGNSLSMSFKIEQKKLFPHKFLGLLLHKKVGDDEVSSKSSLCQSQCRYIQGHCCKNDGSNQWVHYKAQGVREWAWHWVSVDAHQRSNVSNWEGRSYSSKQVQQPLNRTIRGSGSCIGCSPCSSGRFPSAKKTKPKKSSIPLT